MLYTEANAKEETVTVPELKGLTKEQAKATLDMYGLNLTAEGSGYEEEVVQLHSPIRAWEQDRAFQWEQLCR